MVFQIILFSPFFAAISYWLASGDEGAFFGLLDGLLSLAATAIIFGCIISLEDSKRQGFFTFRRALGLALFGVFFAGVGILFGGALSKVFEDAKLLERIYYLICGFIVVYEYTVLAAVSNASRFDAAIKSIIQPALILSVHTTLAFYLRNLDYSRYLLDFLVMCGVALIVSNIYYRRIEGVGKKLSGLGSISLFKSFITSLILDKTELLEKDLQKISIRKDVEIRELNFLTDKEEAKLVAPLVHPGPFRKVGGAMLPTILAEFLSEKNITPIVFHTPTTHEEDPVLSEDCNRIVSTIINSREFGGTGIATKAASKKVGKVTVTVQVFDSTPLIVISRSPIPTEDLPPQVNEFCLKKIREFGYSDGIVVDAHNSMENTYEPFEEKDFADLAMALELALKEIESAKGQLKAGFVKLNLEGYSRKDGIGDGGVMALVTQVEEQRAAFVSIDGNNMVSGLRDKIRAELEKLGYSVSEIATTDTHIVTGMTAGQGYFVLGKAIPEKVIMKKVIEAVEAADSKKANCAVKFSKHVVENVHLLGKGGLEALWIITEESIQTAKRGLLLLLGIPALVATVLALLF